MLLQDSSLQLWFTMSESCIFFLLLSQHLWFLFSLDNFCIFSSCWFDYDINLLLNWCESARNFENTKRLLCVCESSFVIKFTFHSLSVAIIPSNCSNLLQFLHHHISDNSHVVFNIRIIALRSVEKSDSIVDLIFERTTVKKTHCSIAWRNNYCWQTDSVFDFYIMIIYGSKFQISIFDLIHILIYCVSNFFEAVCNRFCHFNFSILLINHCLWCFWFVFCFQCITFANKILCAGWDYSHIHEFLHISQGFKQSLFIFEWSRNLLICFFSMFINVFSDCSVCLGIGRVFELVHFVSQNSESIITHQSKSIELLMKHCLTVWKLCLDLIQIWCPFYVQLLSTIKDLKNFLFVQSRCSVLSTIYVIESHTTLSHTFNCLSEYNFLVFKKSTHSNESFVFNGWILQANVVQVVQ